MKSDLEMMLMMDDVRQALDLHQPEVIDLMVCAQRLMVSAIGQIADRRDTPQTKLRQLADRLADTLCQAMHQRVDYNASQTPADPTADTGGSTDSGSGDNQQGGGSEIEP